MGHRRARAARRHHRQPAHRCAPGRPPDRHHHWFAGSHPPSDPWTLGEQQVIELDVVGQQPRRLEIPAAAPYALEADALARAAATGGEVPELTGENSLGQARWLDAWLEPLSLRFPFERDDAHTPTLPGRPLAAAATPTGASVPLAPGQLAVVATKLPRLVMGRDTQLHLSRASAMFDALYEIGGTTFDTAYVYGGGYTEKLLGKWVENRGIREDVVIIAKGAHTPHCDP